MLYGDTPQNRERIYILAFKDINIYKNFDFPEQIVLQKTIQDIIINDKVDDNYYYTEKNFKYFNLLKENIKNPKTIYQWRR